MNLLITGAVKFTQEQINLITKLDYNITFVQDERSPLTIDCTGFEAVICNGLFLHTPIEKFPNLKCVQLSSAGLDRIPLDYINKHNITLFNARGVYSIPMAEWVILKTLELYKDTKHFFVSQNNHNWNKKRDILEINNKTVCVIGTGSVGMECLKRFKAFGSFCIGVNLLNPNSEYIDEFFSIEHLNEAIKKSDIIVLTLPLTNETKGIINKDKFDIMKNSAVLINVARGGIINEQDLIFTLKNGGLFGAALDVFESEPLNDESPLWDMKNVIITPHNSFVSDSNANRLFEIIYKNLKSFKYK